MVGLAGLVDLGAQAGVAAQLGGGGEATDVADLGGDGVGQHRAHPGHAQQQGHVAVVAPTVCKSLQIGDLLVQGVDQRRPASTSPRHGSGPASRSSSCRPATPNRSDTGQGWPKVISVACIRFFRRCDGAPDAAESGPARARARTAGSGSQIAGTRSRRRQLGQHPGVDLVGLARQRREALDRGRRRPPPTSREPRACRARNARRSSTL